MWASIKRALHAAFTAERDAGYLASVARGQGW
jgi:hypothetical protein